MDNHMARLEGEITPARTLASVAALAAQEGMSVHLARRPSGAGFVIPSLVHLKVGHYAILTAREKDGSYILNDPARVTQMRVSAATLDEELSGACLIASTETLPTTWTALSSAEAGAWYAATFGLLNSLNPLGAISNSDRIGKAVRDCKKNCK
jgi:hypothetical protein